MVAVRKRTLGALHWQLRKATDVASCTHAFLKGALMTKTELLMQERDDLQAKIASAREAKTESERETSDLKMM